MGTSSQQRWKLVDAEAIEENARFYREWGPAGCLRVAEELYDHALAVGAVDGDRVLDLRHHIDLRAKLDRASERALARR